MSVQIQRQRQHSSSSRNYEQYPGSDNEGIDTTAIRIQHAAQKILEVAEATLADIDTLLAEQEQSE